MTQRFAQAARGTMEVEKQVEQALRALDGFRGRTVNGFGVYADPSQRRHDLAKARDSIAAASAANPTGFGEKAMSDTPWPTETDYDAAEAEGY